MLARTVKVPVTVSPSLGEVMEGSVAVTLEAAEEGLEGEDEAVDEAAEEAALTSEEEESLLGEEEGLEGEDEVAVERVNVTGSVQNATLLLVGVLWVPRRQEKSPYGRNGYGDPGVNGEE